MNALLRYRYRGRRAGATILVLSAFAASSSALAQCAMCQGAAGAGADGGDAYNISTLFMLAIPYLLLLGVAGYVANAFRRSRSIPSDDEPPSASERPAGTD